MKFTEGEITSLVRRFFVHNGFRFLSTSADGDKLYYTLPDKPRDYKQPDSIVVKENLVIVCEDKIHFRNLFSSTPLKISDFNKLSTFLGDKEAQNTFATKISGVLAHAEFVIVGCLASLSAKSKSSFLFPENIFNISIDETERAGFYSLEIKTVEKYLKYFPKKVFEIKL